LPQPDHVVVIGGAGFIGRCLTADLLKSGCAVTVVSRSAGANPTPGVRYFRATVADAARITDAIDGASVVYDLSMGGGPAWKDFERDYIQGATNVARACQKHGVRRFIYTSSTAALYLGGSGTVLETGGPDPQSEQRGNYTRAKAAAERLLTALYQQEKLPVVITRPAIVLGPGGMLIHGAIGNQISETCILGWGRGDNPLPCVLARDVAKAMLLAKDAPGIEGKTFNLAGDVRPSAQEIVQFIAGKTMRKFRFFPRSGLSMAFSYYTVNGLKKLFHKQIYESFRDLKSSSMTAVVDCSQARQLLGWKPESDHNTFFQEAFECHIKPVPPGDLRLEPAGIR